MEKLIIVPKSPVSLLVFKKRQSTENDYPENTQENIIEAIKNTPYITRKELEVILGRTTDSIKYHLAKLTRERIIKREGSDRSGK